MKWPWFLLVLGVLVWWSWYGDDGGPFLSAGVKR